VSELFWRRKVSPIATVYILSGIVYLGFGLEMLGVLLTDKNLQPLLRPHPFWTYLEGATILLTVLSPFPALTSPTAPSILISSGTASLKGGSGYVSRLLGSPGVLASPAGRCGKPSAGSLPRVLCAWWNAAEPVMSSRCACRRRFAASPSPLHKCIQRKVDDPG
jgi:hypothetical protein